MKNTVVKFERPAPRYRLECSACGAPGGNSSCDCGAPYVPAGERAAKAVASNPAKSDRAIADELGVGHATVSRARTTAKATVSGETVDKRTGRDGKTRKLPAKPAVRAPTSQQQTQIFLQQLSAFMDDFGLRLTAWHLENLNLDSEARFALVHSLSTRSMQLQILAQTIDKRED